MNRPPVAPPPAPSRREVLEGLTRELEGAGVESSRHEAERLLAHAIGRPRADLLLHLDAAVEAEEAGRAAALARRRLSGVPLQHLEGSVAFRDLLLVCDRRALIPRPETEQLVELVLRWSAAGGAAGGVRRVSRPGAEPRLACALDIGTGSGAIALALVSEGIVRRAVGVDVSSVALEQAAENRRLARLEGRVELRLAERTPWDAIQPEERFDVIVSNPPYVTTSELSGLAPDVRDHEPRVALCGGEDGLEVVRQIASGARAHLRAGGALFLEIGAEQGREAREIVCRAGPWSAVDVHSDLSGRDRFVVALVGREGR